LQPCALNNCCSALRNLSVFAADLYHAAVNLHTRRSHEMQKHSELVELVESARAAGQLNFNMTDDQRKALERLNKVSTALDTSLLRLDGMIALFNEY
jgi:arginyl-tRNA--protein-N-Asp/Glu arginylyltransferase